MSTRTVTGTCYHVDGTAWAGGTVSFELVETFETATEVYPQERHTETLDANGQFSITLGVPDTGTAHYMIKTPDGLWYSVYIAAGAATTLTTLLTIATTAVSQNDLQTLIDAEGVLAVKTKTTDYTIQAGDELVRCTAAVSITLPAATGSGAMYVIKNASAGDVTVLPTGADTIDTASSMVINTRDWSVVLDVAAATWEEI